jgi:cobalt-zinc-cadmium efflux system protein
MDGTMSHAHDHSHADHGGHSHEHHHGHLHGHLHDHHDIRPVRIALALTATVFVAQVVGGIASNSLALLSDAGHVFIDMASLVVAYVGLTLAARARNRHDLKYTFGLRRIEILAALTNGFLLLGMCVYIIIEAVERFGGEHHIHADTMLWVAVVGFIANGISALYLHRSEHITTRSAYLHVLTDLASSAGVIVAAVAIKLTDWEWIDPLISLLIAAVIIRGAVRVIKEAGVILMESAPAHIVPTDVRAAILAIDGIGGVHDVHVWQLGHNEFTASVHVVSQRHGDDVVRDVQAVLRDRFDIRHATVQVESRDMHDNGECGAC